MYRTGNRRIALALSSGLVALLVGLACSSEKGDWQAAQSANSVEAYEGYLGRYPQGRFRSEAEGRIEDFHLADAEERGTVEAFEAFLALHPEGTGAQKSRGNIEDLRLAEAEAADTVAGYRAFLERYPEGSSSDKARALLEAIYPSFSTETVLEIEGISAIVGDGRIVFSLGDEPETLKIRIPRNEVPMMEGKSCLYCARTVELAPNLKISTTLFDMYDFNLGNAGPYVESSVAVQDMELEGPLKKDQAFYIVSGPEGATLRKEGKGFRLVSGQANLLRGKDAS